MNCFRFSGFADSAERLEFRVRMVADDSCNEALQKTEVYRVKALSRSEKSKGLVRVLISCGPALAR